MLRFFFLLLVIQLPALGHAALTMASPLGPRSHNMSPLGIMAGAPILSQRNTSVPQNTYVTVRTQPSDTKYKGTSQPDADTNASEQPDTKVPNRAESSAAAAIISGSPRPGIIEHQLIRSERDNKPEISISYPSFGTKAVDSDIRQWVTSIANAFDASFDEDQALFSTYRSTPELWGSYSVTRPSSNGLSVTFEIWTYTGAVHGNLDIITLNYNTLTAQRLGLVDMFEDPDAALSIMSAWAYKVLSRRLGGLRQEQMLRTGLTPVPENFASLTLTPQGLRINFQPYQVTPGAAGAQRVDIPLDELRPARPLLLLWE